MAREREQLRSVRWDNVSARDSAASTAILRPRALAKGTRKQTAQPDVEQFGPYIVHERLGAGGMASVHRAEMQGLAGFRKSIALKRMWPHFSSDREFVELFIQEARLASQLRHDNIAQAYDLGKIDDTYYIAMELVPGPTLTEVMRQANTAAGAIPLAIVVEILIQLCDALDHAHNLRDSSGKPLNIIHRDVSPANVIISTNGIVKLIDFGIAKAASSSIHTEAGIIKGKLAYVAPEYTLGHLDHRADLFGLGVMAHELLTGQRLFLSDSDYSTLLNVREKPIQPPSRINAQVSRDLDDIVMTALQRDPTKRWQNAAAMRRALAEVARELGMVISGQGIREWIEWAFEQPPRRDTTIARVIDTLEPSISVDRFDRYDDDPTIPPPPPTPASVRVTLSREPRDLRHLPFANTQIIARERARQQRRRTSPWLVAMLLAVLAGAAVWNGWVTIDSARDVGDLIAEPYSYAER